RPLSGPVFAQSAPGEPAATEAPATDAPAAEPPPEPAGTQVYTDDFADPKKSGMENQPKGLDFERGIHSPGGYHLRVLVPTETRLEIFARQSYQNFSAQIDLSDNSD